MQVGQQDARSFSSPAPPSVRVRAPSTSSQLPPRDSWVAAAHGMSLGFSSLAIVLNGLLLAALLCRRVRERCSGILALTGAELALNLIAVANMLAQILVDPNSVPDELGRCAHGAQMTRNWWMLIVTAYRAVITARPQLVSGQPGRQFPGWLQLCLFAGAIALSVCEFFADRMWRLAVMGVDADVANSTAAPLSKMLRGVQLYLLEQISFATFGVLLPAFGVVCLAGRIAYCLRTRYPTHRATRRAARTILLLALVFVALELPYAVSIAGTSVYLLGFCDSRERLWTVVGTIQLMEKFSSWGNVVVPINSSLNFFILLRYSRSFRRLLLQRPRLCCRRWQRQQRRRQLHREQLEALARRRGMQTWQNHRAATLMRQQRQRLAEDPRPDLGNPGSRKCEVVVAAMVANSHYQNQP